MNSMLRTDVYQPVHLRFEQQVARLWAELLGLPEEQIGTKDSFFALGGHSQLAVQLLSRLRAQFDAVLSLRNLFEEPTIQGLLQRIEQQKNAEPQQEQQAAVPASSLLVPLQTSGSNLPIFGIHAVGGGVSHLLELARQLGAEQPFYGLQSLGLLDDHRLHATVEEMAHDYLEAVRTVQPKGPYRFVAYSMGGVVAYEMARQLSDQGEAVDWVALLDCWSYLTVEREPTESEVLEIFANSILGLPAEEVAAAQAELATVEPLQTSAEAVEEHLSGILEQAVAQDLLPAAYERKQLLRRYHVFRANQNAYYHYRPQTANVTLYLFRSTDKQETTGPRDQGWASLSPCGLRIRDIKANHHNLIKPPHVQKVASLLQQLIRQPLPTGLDLLQYTDATTYTLEAMLQQSLSIRVFEQRIVPGREVAVEIRRDLQVQDDQLVLYRRSGLFTDSGEQISENIVVGLLQMDAELLRLVQSNTMPIIQSLWQSKQENHRHLLGFGKKFASFAGDEVFACYKHYLVADGQQPIMHIHEVFHPDKITLQ